METAKAVPVAERLRAIKIGRYTVDEGSHSKHFAVAAVCQEAAQEIERLQEKVDYLLDVMRDVFPAAHRLALELECLLLDSKDMAAVSKWWDSAHEALEQWREFCREDTKVGADKTANAGRTDEMIAMTRQLAAMKQALRKIANFDAPLEEYEIHHRMREIAEKTLRNS